MTARKHDHFYFTGEERGKGDDICSRFELIRLDKGRRQAVVVGAAGSSNSHIVQVPPSNSHRIKINPSNSHKIHIPPSSSHKI